MPLEIIFQHLFKNELFRLSWGAKNARGDEWNDLKGKFETRLVAMQREAMRVGWLRPQGVYGYWACQSDGEDLVIYDPASVGGSPESLTRFTFPRQSSGDYLCLADYFAPASVRPLPPGSMPCKTLATTLKRTTSMVWQCRLPKPPPNTCTVISVAS
jgi:cobalamin-dependent methionine synthase I